MTVDGLVLRLKQRIKFLAWLDAANLAPPGEKQHINEVFTTLKLGDIRLANV